MPLVGRDRPLQTLTDAARDAASGRGRLVLVAGEAGVGKSALVEAAKEQATATRWLTGQCEPSSRRDRSARCWTWPPP